MDKSIYNKICKVFRKYSGNIEPSPATQICLLWGKGSPPNILENTEELKELEKELNFYIDEEDAVRIFDMNIAEAAEYFKKLIVDWEKDNS